ncbi:class I SAM-dependent methyltransferase [Actinoplanes sp. NEAU-A12]|uniref:Class I SAM-dependent methyltransferase n=1 Tax=Actinoplanes sandaracinus TaxID=3045177 RepID=A0ABT6WM60_9ACTN|nr:class I SAM-dependent methyltransferase [Actinoplanes sandaracinus]MDI6100812.1 class I SAM-dependent methyltransferase [Actinoplanes sandaracinus]
MAGTYLFDNATTEAARQVKLLAAILDEHSFGVLRALGPEPGWRCLDLGTGAGSVARFLAGAGCRVDALDTDPRHLDEHELITVRQEDVTTASLGSGVYDLIHARLLLMHLPQREELLATMVAALKPDGHLVISDWDCTRPSDMLLTAPFEVAEAFLAFQNTMIAAGAARGMDVAWARRLPAAMRAAGLRVHGVIHNRFWTGGEPGMQLHACNSRQLEQGLLAGGMTRTQLEVLRSGMENPEVSGYTYPMHTAVGTRV